MTLTRIGVGSAAKVSGALYAGMGLIFGAMLSAASLVGAVAGMSQGDGGSGFAGLLFGVGAIVILPVLYGVIGLVCGAIGAALYNLAAGLIGGIELEFDGRSV